MVSLKPIVCRVDLICKIDWISLVKGKIEINLILKNLVLKKITKIDSNVLFLVI